MNAIFRHLIITLFCISAVACSDSIEIQKPTSRVLVVYMGGDNNLSNENGKKIEALRQIPIPSGGRLVIYSDESNQPPRLQEILPDGKGQNIVSLITEYPESNSADANIFGNVLKSVCRDFPAQSYGLLVFSHASGWLPEGALLNPRHGGLRSIIIDGKNEMELPDFAAAIPDKMFNFIVFETCFMGGVETMYELRHKTDFIVASATEMLSPGLMPIYGDILPALFSPQADLKGVAQKYMEYYNNQTGDNCSATIAVIQTDGLEALTEAASSTLTETMTGDVAAIQHFDRYDYHLFFDFADAYSHVLDKEAFGRLQDKLNQCVIYKAATSAFIPGQRGFTIAHFSGLSTYIEQAGFPYLNERYGNLEWNRDLKNI